MSELQKDFIKIPAGRAERCSWLVNDIMRPVHMVTMVAEVDATPLVRLREEAEKSNITRPSYTSLIVKAAAELIKKNPQCNRAILGPPLFKRLYQFSSTDVAVAVEKSLPAMPGQAFVQPVRNVADKSLSEITLELKALTAADQSNNQQFRQFMRVMGLPRPIGLWLINSPYWSASLWCKYRGGAVFVNGPIKSGADLAFTTWPWPVTFSMGEAKVRPWVVDGVVQARTTLPLVMVFDRRIMGGGPAGRLFVEFQNILLNLKSSRRG